ncbi:MAG: hypothetical protein E6Q42_00600 [Dechloromonas sp.]|nr:MAG: hypothetical protein E6Q42_00600 [Dechloromonas sp.]
MTPHLPTRRLLALAAAAFVSQLSSRAQAADLTVLLFDQGQPVANADVRVGSRQARTSADGSTVLQLGAGEHELIVSRDGSTVLQLKLTLAEDESAELFATLYPDAAPSVFIDSSHANAGTESTAAEDLGPPGRFSGQILNSEDGKPVANARIYVAGTPLDIVTDAEGRFDVPVSAGSYAVSIIAPKFASRSLEAVAIASGETTTQTIELTPSGVELPEFVVLEPFIEGSLASFVEEKRNSSAVADILGAEQISRAGDSDAAGALKRVTGLTLVDGKFVYVRGLGERYSSVVVNGAQVPSPDPTRRVVPLDLFPTEILNGILVQKTYTADMPGEFGGGTIQLRTRGVPDSFFLKASGTLGYADGTTGNDGLRYLGGARDWTGFDDGTREAPDGLLGERLPTNAAELEALGEAVAASGFAITPKQVGPNTGFSFSVGDDFNFSDGDWSLGYIAALRYSQNWDTREETRRGFSVLSSGQLIPLLEYQRHRTERAIDGGAFFSTGLTIGEHHNITGTLFQVRQTTDQAQIDEGLQSSGNFEQQYELEWVENELTTRQLDGEHVFTALNNLLLHWQVTEADASRYSPNKREYRFTFDEGDQVYLYDGVNFIRYETLADDASQRRLDLKWPWDFSENGNLTLMAGADQLERARDSAIRRFNFRGRRPAGAVDIDDIFSDEAIAPGGLFLQDSTQSTDSYIASQTLDATYLAADFSWGKWRANAGVREERNDQVVITQALFNPTTPVIGGIQSTDRLPSASLTWAYSDAAQVRLGYSTTLSRPDFRELSTAPWIDPLLDIRVTGNPNLKQAEIESIDLRWEYYFSPSESFSAALFSKQFTNPIELVLVPASGELLNLKNAKEATNQGIEFDYYRAFSGVEKWDFLPDFLQNLPWQDIYLGANYAWIESEIDLGDQQGTQTNAIRPLQGQSPYVANVSVAYLHPDGDVEATLLYNISGERISQVGDSGLPDVYEQPFGQLDFTISAKLPWAGWKAKARLRNLLDPTSRFEQGDGVTREFKKGRELALSVEWSW